MKTYPKMTIHAAIAKDRGPLLVLNSVDSIGEVPNLADASRIAACWNACREFDDPEKGVEALLDQSKGKCSRWTASEIDRLNNLLAERDRTISQQRENINDALTEVGQLRSMCHGYEAARQTTIGPSIETTIYVTAGEVQPLTDPIEEALDVLADLVELWKRNRAKGRGAVSIRGAILLTVAEIERLTSGCQTK